MSYELLRQARFMLEPILKKAQMKGSTCWGPKTEFNVHSGPNLVFCIGDEMITISQPGDRLRIRQFTETTDTELGRRVALLLQRKAVDGKERTSFPTYTASCLFGWKKEFDAGIAAEVDSRGEGSKELIEKIHDEHKKAHPDCDPANVEILNPQMVKIGRLSEFLVSEK